MHSSRSHLRQSDIPQKTGGSWVEAGDVVAHQTVPRIAPTTSNQASVNSARIKKTRMYDIIGPWLSSLWMFMKRRNCCSFLTGGIKH